MVCKRLGFVFVFVVLASVLVSGVYAQMAGTGQVIGTVVDPSGAAVVGVTLTLTNTATSAVRTTTSNETGKYTFAQVDPGLYDLVATKGGFRQIKIAGQQVVIGETRTFDLKMELGMATETVEVMATNTELQTMNATVGNTITGVALESLPGLGRDVSTFVTLQPGVAPDGSVAGANQDQNSFQLDGGNNSSDMDGTQNTYTPSFAGDPTGGLVNNYVTGTGTGAGAGGGPTGVMPTPIDSIEEFKVGTTNQTADFNASAGAQVQLVTRRGTNTWHGTAYEYYLDNLWNANTFDNNTSSPATPRPGYHYSHFGAAGGGPVIPKEVLGGKWYFFANYEGLRYPSSSTRTRAVPSDALKQGILQFKTGTDASGSPTYSFYNLNPTPVTYTGPTTAAGLTNGTVIQPAICTATPGDCDPRALGISPTVQAMWTQYMPESNISSCGGLSRCDHLNVLAFRANAAIPWNDNFGVTRLDHDFGSKWHFNATYRYYHLTRATTNQINIGGNVNGKFPGDTLGVPAASANRPQVPWYLTAGLNTNITSNLTNDFHFSYLRNYWARASAAQPPQIPGLGGALEPFGESSTNVLSPYNLDTQNVRTRFWNGQDKMIRDDLFWSKGSHFLQFGGTYQHNFNWHQRTDNGGGINYQSVYWLGAGVGTTNGMDMSGFVPAAVTAAKLASSWARLYGIVLGVPAITQIAYTRTGPNLTLNPPNTPAFDQSTIPFYNLYFSDSWRMKPSFTLSYGLGWTLEMPPTEKDGKQVTFVDGNSNKPIDSQTYLNARANAALQGQVYNPLVGFTLNGNVAGHPKYPYNPFYKGFSPRVAVAWNPSYDSGLLGDVFGRNKTVIRGGYSLLFGRLNGVDLVLVPLLGTGLIQAVQCVSPVRNDPTCLSPAGAGGSTPRTAFRIGPTGSGFDGLVAPLPAASQTLPQPDIPGVNAIAAGAGEGLDPGFKPSRNQQYDITVQRQINSRVSVEFGYIGRSIAHEFQPVQLNAVPYMMTLKGQSFAKAYGQMVWQYCGGASGLAGGGCTGNLAAVTPQPFFEAALKPAYCAGYASCTAAVADKEGVGKNGNGNIAIANVWSLWSDLDTGTLGSPGGSSFFNFPRSMMNTPLNCPTGGEIGCGGQLSSGVGMNTSLGYGNYNAGFVTVKMASWRGLTLQTNFTYGKALGTGSEVQATSQFTVPDAYHLRTAYGPQVWDRKFLYNLWMVYELPFYKNQQGFVGRVVGGWSIAPIFVTGSGLPEEVAPSDNNNQFIYGGGQSFGESDGSNFGALQNAINMCGPGVGGSSRHNNPTVPTSGPLSGIGSSWYGPSQYQNPAAVYSCFRNPILGIDGSNGGGAGVLRGLPYWNVDFSIKKNVKITERFSTEFTAVFTNIFNHNQMSDPLNVLGDVGDWGGLGGLAGAGQANSPRSMEFGLRVRF